MSLLKMDPKMVVVEEWRYVDLVVHTMMHAIVVVLPMRWLLKMDATMWAMVQQQHPDSELHASMNAHVLLLP